MGEIHRKQSTRASSTVSFLIVVKAAFCLGKNYPISVGVAIMLPITQEVVRVIQISVSLLQPALSL